MKKNPNPLTPRLELNLKLGIKSSITNIKQLFATLFSLYLVNGSKAVLEYSDEVSTSAASKVVLKAPLAAPLDAFFSVQLAATSTASIVPEIKSSALFTSLVEHLQVAIELFWRLGRIEFVGAHSPSEERTGGNRYARRLKFSSNMDVLKYATDDSTGKVSEELKNILFNWIRNDVSLSEDQILVDRIINLLTLFSEETQFKIRNGSGQDIIFQQESIYSVIVSGDTVENNDRTENVGPLRVLNTAVKAGLHSFIKEDGANGFNYKDGKTVADLENYAEKVSNLLSLNPKKITVVYETSNDTTTVASQTAGSIELKHPRNKIIYGAPGTGKSYFLREQAMEIGITDDYIIRITFHPSYSYQSFVGTYKPTPIYKSLPATSGNELFEADKTTRLDNQKEPIIDYSLSAGPFLELLIKALKDPDNNYMLIIEEINRANVSSVFGDVFQLLDRDKDGTSEYEIDFNKDITSYLKSNGIEGRIKLPANLFIWATMNSADQGVMPLDAAFKRRWSFHYLPIDEMEHIVSDYTMIFQGKEYSWNKFRKDLNEKLKLIPVPEDKLIGPFFLSTTELADENSIKNKLLLYLRDDVVRHNPNSLFKSKTFSDIIQNYNNDGEVFVAGLNSINWEIIIPIGETSDLPKVTETRYAAEG